jgi:phage portal protein BeeE
MFDWTRRTLQVTPTTLQTTGSVFGIFDRRRPSERTVQKSMMGTFAACIRTRAKLFAQVATADLEGPGFAVERMDGDGWEPVEGSHPWLGLLRRPNRHRSPYDFWLWVSLARDLHGRATSFIEGDPVPQSLTEIYSAFGEVRPKPSPDGGVSGYVFHRRDGLDIDVPAEDVMDIRRVDPTTPYESTGLVESLAAYIGADLGAMEYQARAFEDGRPPLFQVVTDQDVSPDEQRRFGTEFKRRFMQGDEVPVMGSGMRAESLSVDPQQWQMLEAQGLTHRVIYRVTGVPEAYFDSENANRSNSESAERKIRRDTIQPVLNQAAAQLTLSLTRAFGAEPGVLRVRPPRALQPTPAEREAINEQRLARGVPPAQIMEEEGEALPQGYEDALSRPLVSSRLTPLGSFL